MTGDLYACLRIPRLPEAAAEVAREFSPRIERHGDGCVVLDVSGLGGLLGEPAVIAYELARAAGERCGLLPAAGSQPEPAPPAPILRAASRYGIRINPRPLDVRTDPPPPAVDAAFRVAVAPTQVCSMLLSLAPGGDQGRIARCAAYLAGRGHDAAGALAAQLAPRVAIVGSDIASALADVPVRALQQLLAGVHGVTLLRRPRGGRAPDALPSKPGWPAWDACETAFDVLDRWGIRTLGDLAALPAADLSARIGQTGVRLQRLACGADPCPLVPEPDVPRYLSSLELEWPIDALEPLSFVLSRLLDPVSAALARADRGAVALRLDLRLVDRTTFSRVVRLPAPMRDARVLRTLLLLDLESHPPPAAIDVVSVEADPAPGRILQYSLLEHAMPSAETLATLIARLGALVGETRCGSPVLLDTHRPDGFELQRFAPADRAVREPRARRGSVPAAAAGAPGAPRGAPGEAGSIAFRRFRPPMAVRVEVDRGRPVSVAVARRGMPGGRVQQWAGPWRSSGAWWDPAATRWDRDEWDVALTDGSLCRLFRDRDNGRWFVEGVFD